KKRSPGLSCTSMLAPENPPRVGSKVAPVTLTFVFAARGIDPADIPIPFRVVRFDSAPEPSMDGPAAVIVTFDMVPATALRSPAVVGGTSPLTPSSHFSEAPVSGSNGETSLRARTGLDAVTFTGELGEVRSENEVGDQLALAAFPLHSAARRSEAGCSDVDEVITRARVEAETEGASAVGGRFLHEPVGSTGYRDAGAGDG